jgi:hypothetical protein
MCRLRIPQERKPPPFGERRFDGGIIGRHFLVLLPGLERSLPADTRAPARFAHLVRDDREQPVAEASPRFIILKGR